MIRCALKPRTLRKLPTFVQLKVFKALVWDLLGLKKIEVDAASLFIAQQMSCPLSISTVPSFEESPACLPDILSVDKLLQMVEEKTRTQLASETNKQVSDSSVTLTWSCAMLASGELSCKVSAK